MMNTGWAGSATTIATTSRPMSSPHAKSLRRTRAARWLAPAALLALTPKCLLCVLAYAGLGAALGLGGPEICGASAGSPASWASSLAWLGGMVGLGAIGAFLSCKRADRIPSGLD